MMRINWGMNSTRRRLESGHSVWNFTMLLILLVAVNAYPTPSGEMGQAGNNPQWRSTKTGDLKTFNTAVHPQFPDDTPPGQIVVMDELTPLTIDFHIANDAQMSGSVSYSLGAGAPLGANIDVGSGLFSWTPQEFQGPGTNLVTVMAMDNGKSQLSASKTFTIIVNEVNTPPVMTPLVYPVTATKLWVMNENQFVGFTVKAADIDLPAQTLLFSLDAGAPEGAFIDPIKGAFSWRPGENQGPSTNHITVRVTDDGSPPLSDWQTFTIIVNAVNTLPILMPVADHTVDELSPLTVQIDAVDNDLPAQNLTFSLGLGAPVGAEINPQTGLLTWTPTEAQGPTNIAVRVVVTDDGQPPLSTNMVFTVKVKEVNIPPSLDRIPDQTLYAFTNLTLMVHATDSDLPPQILTCRLAPGAPAGAKIDSSTGLFSWTPGPAQNASTNRIIVIVNDSSTPTLYDTNSFSIIVQVINTAPVMETIPNQVVNESESLNLDVHARDIDLPVQDLAFSLGIGSPFGSKIDSKTGAFTWTPTEAQGPGNNQITVVVTDNGVPPLSATNTFQVVVNEVNTPPTVETITNQTVNELATLTVAVRAVDADVPAQSLSFTLGTNTPVGAKIDAATGTFSWTPTEAQGPSTNQIAVIVTDNGVPPLSATNTFQVVVNEVNTPPIFTAPPNQSIVELQPWHAKLEARDSDLPADKLTFSLLNGPEGMTLDSTTGELNWTPSEAQGPSTNLVVVEVTDNGVPSLNDRKAFTIFVQEANTPPVLYPIPDQTLFVLSNLTLNAQATDIDLPSQRLTFSLAPNAPTGAKIDASTGVFSWTPAISQGPSTNQVTVIVKDTLEPGMSGQELTASNTFTITVLTHPPEISMQPVSMEKTAGSLAALKMTANGTIPLFFQWYKDGKALEDGENISGVHSVSLNLTNLLKRDEGGYSVVVSNSSGSATSQVAYLAVIDPAIYSQPESQSKEPGQNAVFSVQALGTPPLNYQWFKDGIPLADGVAISGAATDSLSLRNISGADTGAYLVVVSNRFSSVASSVAILTVNDPIILTQPSSRTANAGQETVFKISALGSGPLNYQWYKNDLAITNGGNTSGAKTESLVLNGVLGTDAGIYRVVVGNNYQSVSSAVAVLSVIDPVITVSPASQNVDRSQNLTLQVGAVGTRPINYQWFKDGVFLANGTNEALALVNLQAADAGTYYVVAANQFGKATSKTADVLVNLPVMETNFKPGANGAINAVVVQPDGKIVVGGEFTQLGGMERHCLGRLNQDGTLDAQFNPSAGGNDYPYIYALALQPDGKIVVGGNYTQLGGVVRHYLARLNPDGSIDSGFNPDADGSVYALAAQADGKLLIGGEFAKLSGRPRQSIARLNTDGTLDRTFDPSANGNVFSLLVQTNGQILAGGSFTGVGGFASANMARINQDGSPDVAFKPDASGSVLAMVLQPDGKIVAGGDFLTVGGNNRQHLVRLNSGGGLDSGFSPLVNKRVSALALQVDGQILSGGSFTASGDTPQPYLSRISNHGVIDSKFNLKLNDEVTTLAIQPDGRILVAGYFSNENGTPHEFIGRISTGEDSVQKLSMTGLAAIWTRSGVGPEVLRTSFDSTVDGTNWLALGMGQRVDTGWQLNGASLPAGVRVRARGEVAAGGASSWYVESVSGNDKIPGSLGIERVGGIPALRISGTIGQDYFLESAFTLPPVNGWASRRFTLTNSPQWFFDDAATNRPQGFYRLK